ncbi:phosphopantetheinyl transferase (holo-ACP synthase) [Saccharothrix ecbatanensis]|jgi:phosphopantetheinyl transferase (holo-ACP synthase)|uniref:Phosphopantetheinyl transferase (Holo-ACP synthase) n=1 Tax=Saccharothrix ecbatanensis TaxID=1105145 RepID=A0A7W9M096_9PSEU|nr:phosphopantetheinyl transferase [Saccharothrix ecbatanensis]MBB5802527.1 phosphopantetheinyl transferase (holo-ACP synthase) [Saccharothrix ecbatanensis]
MRRWGSAAVALDGLTAPRQLVWPMRLEDVYSREERLRSAAGRTLQHWAGRLAAKYAVLSLLGLPATALHLGRVEVLPQPSAMCARTTACTHGHPPCVRLLDGLPKDPDTADTLGGGRIGVSISHTADLAFAVALVSARLPEDDVVEAVGGWN